MLAPRPEIFSVLFFRRRKHIARSPSRACARSLAASPPSRACRPVPCSGVRSPAYHRRCPPYRQKTAITVRLREHGHIEGKNVFYWFQNHKAHQRQKQKQQSFDYFSKLFRCPSSLPVLHRPLVHPFPLTVPPAKPLPPSAPTACNTGGGGGEVKVLLLTF
uniref:Uncharacterized protein n=1 Tax=Oryza brachyantha TaxID=4533 RepID=J3NEX9_ORYBR